MSYKTWKKEFYPTPADSIETELGAARHSLRKWRGALKKNLKKHGIKHKNLYPYFYSDDCALCYLFEKQKCINCPLYQIRGNVMCCDPMVMGDEKRSPYLMFRFYSNPRPMIRWLEKVVKKLESKDAK